ncbi:ABC transporter ATP-binding protein [Planomonospora sp. ID67723]|uniref:ABC transporter ATP-binding protein n=1 Tax=Planomonospora sp. ID67723 TaxID=2738134 RepID=UPI0018C3D276|nr:ABC transporter ATP-binding protein [Planomonospora sp. ID67723]MBG0833170.1 ABC transporter ATP-binding protein [Planomonospora sp. ID67723]
MGDLDLRETEAASVRARIGVVTQDVQVFAATVRDNLTLFRPEPGDERLRAVLAEAGLLETRPEMRRLWSLHPLDEQGPVPGCPSHRGPAAQK